MLNFRVWRLAEEPVVDFLDGVVVCGVGYFEGELIYDFPVEGAIDKVLEGVAHYVACA